MWRITQRVLERRMCNFSLVIPKAIRKKGGKTLTKGHIARTKDNRDKKNNEMVPKRNKGSKRTSTNQIGKIQ